MGEIMFKEMIKEIKDMDIKVVSAGTWALEGHRASQNAIKVMEERNIDLSKHRSTPLTESLVNEADLILTMTKNHKNQILSQVPKAHEKVYTLKEYGSYNFVDIMDPFGGNIQIYRKCATEIEEALKKVLEKIKIS